MKHNNANYNINNNTTTTNQRQCTCQYCNNTLQKGTAVKVYSRNAYAFMCPDCATRFNGGYCTENNKFINQQTKTNKCTISIECEVPCEALNYQSEQSFGWLINQADFLKTDDCTVWAEYKSPIYNNLLGLSKVLGNFEKLNQLEKWHDAPNYGTHLNIGNEDLNLSIIERFYHSLFVPFCEYLQEHREDTKLIHGRYFQDIEYNEGLIHCQPYANTINYNTSATSHSNFINLQHSTHIEFRLCKLYSAKQYLLCARMYQDIVQNVLVNYFIKRYDEAMSASQKRELAQKASQKMCKIFDRYVLKLKKALDEAE